TPRLTDLGREGPSQLAERAAAVQTVKIDQPAILSGHLRRPWDVLRDGSPHESHVAILALDALRGPRSALPLIIGVQNGDTRRVRELVARGAHERRPVQW